MALDLILTKGIHEATKQIVRHVAGAVRDLGTRHGSIRVRVRVRVTVGDLGTRHGSRAIVDLDEIHATPQQVLRLAALLSGNKPQRKLLTLLVDQRDPTDLVLRGLLDESPEMARGVAEADRGAVGVLLGGALPQERQVYPREIRNLPQAAMCMGSDSACFYTQAWC